MRYVFIDLSSDNYLQHPQIFGGYAGEHNETVLQVKLPSRIISTEYSGYRFDFQTSEDNKISSPIITELQDDILSFSLPEQLTVAGSLLFNISAILSNGDSISLISKTNLVTLYIGDSADGNTVLLDTTGYKDEILSLIDARILEINPAKVDQTYKATSENAQSGKATAEAISAAAPSISKTICGTGIVTINDVSTIEHNLIVKVDNTTNLLSYPYGNLPENGTVISDGVTYADNGDGTITMSSTDGATSSDVGLNLGTVSLTPGITYYTYHEYVEGYDSEFIHMQFVYQDENRNYKFADQVTWNDNYTLMGIKLYLETGFATDTTLIPVVSITPKSTTYANTNLSDITVTVTDTNGNVQSANPNRLGFVEGLKSASPSMTISASSVVVIECTYNIDTKKYIDSLNKDSNLIIDSSYNPYSPNAQSGVAVAEATKDKPTVHEGNLLTPYNLAMGTYSSTEELFKVGDIYINIDDFKIYQIVNVISSTDSYTYLYKILTQDIDQSYNPNSSNAQSGKAIASALINYVPIRSGATWVFDGGNASTCNSVNIPLVLDNVMSDDSENVVINKVIKAYIDAKYNTQQLALTQYTINYDQQIGALALSLEQHIANMVDPLSPIADYPVEVGTYTDSESDVTWTYRKWNSGIAECWGVLKVYDANNNLNPNSGAYYAEQPFSANFPPDLFTGKKPQIFVDVQHCETECEIKRAQCIWTTEDNTGAFYIYTNYPYQPPVDNPFMVSFEAKGVWK